MPTQTLNRVQCIDDDGDAYTLTIPAVDEAAACAMAEAQGHKVTTAFDRNATAGKEYRSSESTLSKVSLAMSFGGLMLAPLAIVGIVLGAQERNRAAVVVGVIALALWALALVALIG